MKRILTIVSALFLLFGLTACNLLGMSSNTTGIVIPPESSSGDRVLPDLPTEVKYEDFIGEFPDNYYLSFSQDTLVLLSKMLNKTCGELTIAATPSATHYRINADGVLAEVVDETEIMYIRKGGKGSFSKTRISDEYADAYTQMTDGFAEMANGMRLQYFFDREVFSELEVTALRFEEVAGRDCTVYSIVYENMVDMIVYLDFDTKVCLKLVDNINENVDVAFAVFKTSDFSIPKYK